ALLPEAQRSRRQPQQLAAVLERLALLLPVVIAVHRCLTNALLQTLLLGRLPAAAPAARRGGALEIHVVLDPSQMLFEGRHGRRQRGKHVLLLRGRWRRRAVRGWR